MGLKDLSSQQICKLGETAVALELMKRGYDVINLNESLQNYMNADLLCISGKTGNGIKIQVKTGTTENIRCGLIADPATGVIQNLDERVICPWVFVHVADKTNQDGSTDFKFDYYILTRDETRELLRVAHDWYANDTKNGRKLQKNILVGMDIPWLMGEDFKDTSLHNARKNPLKSKALNQWDKIAL